MTINNPAGGGANDLALGILNRTHWPCNNGPGYRFPTLVAANSDVTTNATQGGFTWWCPDNLTETTTSQTDIGSSSKTNAIELQPGNNWTCNDTNAGTDACWNLHNGSSIFGMQNGTQGSSRTGGAYLKYACTAKTAYGINTPEGQSGSGQGYAMVKNISLEGCPTGSVAGGGSPSTALVNIEGISEVNQWENSLIFNGANTILTRIASNNNSAANQVGPIVLTNWWNDCEGLAGCRPHVITGSVQGVLPIYDIGGVCNHPGPNLACYEVNGNSTGGLIYGGHISKYFEQLNAANNSLMVKWADTNNFTLSDSAMVAQTGDTGVDISQTAAGRSCALQVSNLRMNNSALNAIVNHVSTVTMTGFNYYPFYHYGGDSTCSVAPVTIDSNELDIKSRTGTMLFQFPLSGNSLLTGPVQVNGGSGSFSIGSISGQLRIDAAGSNGGVFRPLSAANAISGFTTATMVFSETTAPSTAAAIDSLYGDSTQHALMVKYNNAGVFSPLVTASPCIASQVTETGAATVLTCTPVAVAGSYRIRFVMSVSAASAATLGWTLTWTDSNGAAQTPTNEPLFQSGTAAPALTFTTSAAGNYSGDFNVDINNAGTAIVVKLTFSGTSFTAKVTATVERIV